MRHIIITLGFFLFLGLKSADKSWQTVAAADSEPKSPPKMKVAICLTGQLLRLEILSKIQNLIAYNAVTLGHQIDVFVMLDNNITEAKQTFWRYDYSNTLYRNMTTKTLLAYFQKHIAESVVRLTPVTLKNEQLKLPPINVRAIMGPPTQSNFTIRGGKVPVSDKRGPEGVGPTEGDIEPAALRFQNNLRWMTGLRDCVKWVQHTEFEQKWFYDLVVRLRDDSYLLGPWPLTAEKYKVGLRLGLRLGFTGLGLGKSPLYLYLYLYLTPTPNSTPRVPS
jgi:hypothetical protein